MDALGKIVDFILVVVVMFIAPLLWMSAKSNQIESDYVNEVIADFTDTVSRNGYISSGDYEQLVKRIGACRTRYSISIVHRQQVYEPEYNGSTFTGNVMTFERDTYTDGILDVIGTKGAYLMDLGDVLSVTAQPETNIRGAVSFMASVLTKNYGRNVITSRAVIDNIFWERYQTFY